MPFKSLLTISLLPKAAQTAVDAAAVLAQEHGGHLEAIALGIDRMQLGYNYVGASTAMFDITHEHAKDEALKNEAALQGALDAQDPDLRWSLDSLTVQNGLLAEFISTRARYADLAVLPRPSEDQIGVDMQHIIEAAMFEGMAAVLVVPDQYKFKPRPKRVVLAWNQSREALVAVRRALPFLKTAERVIITVVDPPQHGVERSDPGGQLCQFLVRHGVKAEVSVLARSLPRVSDVLLRQCTDHDADLLVMGAYSHSRLREAILGGTTRHLLETTPLPIFMAH